jgi:glycine betaine/proline transport system ATP-binding protein
MQKPIKLDCRNVWKLYGDRADSFLRSRAAAPTPEDINKAGLIGAVRDANVQIHDGEIFVIMGLSGSGKSTLVRCLSRLIKPTMGEVLFEGQDFLRMPEKKLIEIRRNKMGMVFQHFALLPHLTVLQNVAFPLEIQGVARDQREPRAREVVELVGLKGRESYFPLVGGWAGTVVSGRAVLGA